MPSLDMQFAKAKRLVRQGKYQDARALYNSILENYPANKRAKQGMSKLGELIELSAITTISENFSKGRYTEVVKLAKDFIKIKSDSPIVWNLLGAAHKSLGNTTEALDAFKKVTQYDKSNRDGLNNLGICFQELGQFDKAISAYQNAINLSPDFAEAHYNLGSLYYQINLFDEAIATLKIAIEIKQDYAEALNNLGLSHSKKADFYDAIYFFKAAIKINPNFSEAILNLADIYIKKNMKQSALTVYTDALTHDPDHPFILNNMSILYRDIGEPELAIEKLHHCISKHPHYAEAHYALANVFKDKKCLDEAILYYNKALDLKKDFAEAQVALAMTYLELHEFSKGFDLLESRHRISSKENKLTKKLGLPIWDGKVGQSIIVLQEQGIGDVLLYCSLLSELSDISKSVTMLCDERLVTLLQRSFENCKIAFVSDTNDLPINNSDSQISVGSLLKHFRRRIEDFSKNNQRYLTIDENRKSEILNNLPKTKKLLVGVSWRGGSVRNDSTRLKDMAIPALGHLLSGIEATFINLQYGDVDEDLRFLFKNYGVKIAKAEKVNLYEDLDGLATLIDMCDHVITIDNLNVHIAGALEVNTHLMLPYSSDWRWGDGAGESYWHKSVKLYRQTKYDDWDQPSRQILQYFNRNIALEKD